MDYLQLSEQVKLVQSKLDIYEIVSSYVNLREDGELYIGNCPFHKDDGESLAVNAIEGKFYCKSCHAGGSALNFLARIHNVSLQTAFEMELKLSPEPRALSPLHSNTEVNDYARDFYHEILTAADEGETCRKYLQSRGITKREIEKYQLGFAPNHARILTTFLDSYDFKLYEMVQSGLVEATDEGFIDKFQECLTIPILNQFGNTTALIGEIADYEKKIFYESDGINERYVYPKETAIFNKRKLIFGLKESRKDIVKLKSVIVVENCLDAIYLSSVGVKNVVSVFANTLTIEQAEILSDIAEKIIFCLKNGEVVEFEEFVLTDIARKGSKIFVAALSENVYDFVSKNGTEIFRKNLEDSLPFNDYEFSKKLCSAITTTQKLVPINQQIFGNANMLKAGDAILNVACRESGVFEYAMTMLPKEIFSESQQALIEYLQICLDENSRPSKEGAAIFFDGIVDEKLLSMLDNSQTPTEIERMACEDGLDFLLKKVWNVNYSQIKIEFMTNYRINGLKKLVDLKKLSD